MPEHIKYPLKHSEAEIQASLWVTLRHFKIDARLEVSAPSLTTHINTRRLDVVVFQDKVAICIIECKSWSDNYTRVAKYQRIKNTKQIRTYAGYYQLPVLICARMSFVKQIVKDVQRLLGE